LYSDASSESDDSEAAAVDTERLAKFHVDRMLKDDARNSYKLAAIIDYDEDES